MKYCLSSRQTKEYLKKADQIKVAWRDRGQILDLIEDYSDKTIILSTYNAENEEWDKIKQINTMLRGNFILEVYAYNDIRECATRNIRCYYGMPISVWHEARELIDLGVCYLLIAPPLTHQMEKIKKLNVPIRMIPNICYYDNMPRDNGVSGGWVRPEDTEAYAEYVDLFEFADCDREKEQALYRIYTSGEWPGELEMLITGLDYEGTNRMINPETSRRRMNCGQKCEELGSCHLCYNMLKLANPDKLRPIAEELANQALESAT